ncbi:MAG: tetratricopeptide repeat protein [Planctomycetota bacterium]
MPDLDPAASRTRPRLGPLYLAVTALAIATLGGCALDSSTRRENEAQRQERLAQQLQDARNFADEGLDAQALAAFNAVLADNPDVTEAHLGIGDIYRQNDDYASAETAYANATVTDPNNLDAHYYLGLMRQLLGKVDQAVTAYLRALLIDPNDFNTRRDLAAAYLQLGEPGQALEHAVRATELDPDSQPAWTNLAAAYALLGDHAAAVDAYRQAAELGPLADQVLLGLADAHIKLGNLARAQNVLESLIRRNPTPTAYERLGYVQFKTRSYAQALRTFRQALRLDPGDTAALNGEGVALMTLYIRDGRIDPRLRDAAIASWRRSIQSNPNQTKIVDLLSRYEGI